MAEKVLHVIIKILMYIFIVLLFILLFVRMSGVGRAIFADKPKDKNPQIASETVLVVEQGAVSYTHLTLPTKRIV